MGSYDYVAFFFSLTTLVAAITANMVCTYNFTNGKDVHVCSFKDEFLAAEQMEKVGRE